MTGFNINTLINIVTTIITIFIAWSIRNSNEDKQDGSNHQKLSNALEKIKENSGDIKELGAKMAHITYGLAKFENKILQMEKMEEKIDKLIESFHKLYSKLP